MAASVTILLILLLGISWILGWSPTGGAAEYDTEIVSTMEDGQAGPSSLEDGEEGAVHE